MTNNLLKLLVIAAVFALAATPSHAHHRHHHHVQHTESASPALNVITSAHASFSGLVSDFQSLGYAIGHPGCLSSGHMRHSKHHWGGACDLFNQIARNRTALRQPPPHIQIEVASRHGLISGCIWRHPDCGHFEVYARR